MSQPEYQKTKKQLEDIALQLFIQNGYDKTSISAIVKKGRVSKGAFYYYFKSKEEILESVVDGYAQEIKQIIQKILNQKELSGLEKFNESFVRISAYKAQNINRLIQLNRLINNSNDSKFQEKFIARLLKEINEPFQKIIKQGMKEGSFNTKYPEEIMGALIHLGIYILESIRNLPKDSISIKIVTEKLLFIQDAMTKILGAKDGDIKFTDLKSLKYFYKNQVDDYSNNFVK